MKSTTLLLLLIVVFAAGYLLHSFLQKKPAPSGHQPMTLESLGRIIAEAGENVRDGETYWEFVIEGVPMACITDQRFDRMRIVAPIVPAARLSEEQRETLLEANFHSALDGRYAVSDGMVYAAFIHPLSPLDRTQVLSAMMQVAELARTFGSSYSSGVLSFGRPGTQM